MIKPISPDEVKIIIPDFIIQAVNHLIKEKWDGDKSNIKQDEIIERVIDPHNPNAPTRNEIFSKHWLDFEDIYRKAGWIVDYYKPSYGEESFAAYFIFKKQSNK